MKEVFLDENDDIWSEMRHQHIAEVLESVSKQLKHFKAKVTGGDKTDMRKLGQIIKSMPQHQKEMDMLTAHLHMAGECQKNVNQALCNVEQDLVMGVTSEGLKIRDQMSNIVSILLDPIVSQSDKIRYGNLIFKEFNENDLI